MKQLINIFLLLLAVMFVLNNYYFFNTNIYISFLEKHFSPDGQIENEIHAYLALQILITTLLYCLYIFKNIYRKLAKIKELNIYHFITLISSFILLLLFYLGEFIVGESYTLHDEDSLFEGLTAFFAILAALLFLIKMKMSTDFYTKGLLFLLFIFSFVFGMEEISWGQRLFEWETSSSWKVVNYQDETNLHNLFNPILYILYFLFNFMVGIFFLNAEKIKKYCISKSSLQSIVLLIPKKEANYYALLFMFLIFQSVVSGGELTEEILSVILLAYAITYLKISDKKY